MITAAMASQPLRLILTTAKTMFAHVVVAALMVASERGLFWLLSIGLTPTDRSAALVGVLHALSDLAIFVMASVVIVLGGAGVVRSVITDFVSHWGQAREEGEHAS